MRLKKQNLINMCCFHRNNRIEGYYSFTTIKFYKDNTREKGYHYYSNYTIEFFI